MLPHISNISNYTNGAMVHGARCKSHNHTGTDGEVNPKVWTD